jgi:hypothetical protein
MASRRLVLFAIVLVFFLLAGIPPTVADAPLYLPLLTTGYASSWHEVGIGSASGGGISDSPGRSEKPSLALESAPAGP